MQHIKSPSQPSFDYTNAGWPRDFDIRIEVAEQQEVIRRYVATVTEKPRQDAATHS